MSLEAPHPHEEFVEVADRVFVRRHRFFDSNSTLIVGDDACLVIDTRTTHEQGADLAERVRRITPHPWTVVNTHHHFDHVFGNSAFLPCDVWGHPRCAEILRADGEAMRTRMIGHATAAGRPDLAEQLEHVVVHPPNQMVSEYVDLSVGGRSVQLHHLGRGHTDNDVVVRVPDCGLLHAGDLVEEGGPPSFNDSYPLDWFDTMSRVSGLSEGVVVPGHGAVVDREFVDNQRAEIGAVVALAREVHAEGGRIEDAAVKGPFGEDASLEALERAVAQLRGELT
jgi:glyoxylase-like metal-dependent hydrolase (beta-lactamase superfamily II)